MLPYFSEKFGNAASRTHPYGWVADEAVKAARNQVADLIGAEPGELLFTSGATESCNLAIKGIFEAYASKGNHIITCTTEHKAVLDTCGQLEKRGAAVTYLPVDAKGCMDLNELEQAITPQTILIAVMYANNETGVIHPVNDIAAIAQKHAVIFFTDATQAVGKLPVNVGSAGIGMLALSAHKIYGPKGVGALYVRRKGPRVKPKAQIDGGGHQNGFRSGTLNVPGIVGLGKACSLCELTMKEEQERLEGLRNKLISGLENIAEIVVNGDRDHMLSHVANLSFIGYKAERLISLLNNKIAFSVGSACTSASQGPSHVLEAMGLDQKVIDGAIRLSLGRPVTEADIENTITCFAAALNAAEKYI
jgi:cysteine desulfurase